MQLVDRVRESEFLGREFLLWIWFRGETGGGRFELGKGEFAELWIDRKVVLQQESENGVEKLTCTGDNPHLKEARYALTKNKEVTEARIRLIKGDNEYSFILDSAWMNFRSFRTPKVVQDTKEDPEGIFYEKIYLIEEAMSAMDAVYEKFINLRLSPDWKESELPSIFRWMGKGG